MSTEAVATSDRQAVLERLAAADGYTVFDRRGKRIGAFIEFADRTGTKIAIRDDGVLVWRRRVVPLSTVSEVIPESDAVVLNVDKYAVRKATRSPEAPAASGKSGKQNIGSEGRRRALINFYVSPENGDAWPAAEIEAAPHDADQIDKPGLERHLLFVSTSRGYHLLERHGPAPGALDYVSLAEHPGVFRVMKLAPSPLPNDRTICAYLEHAE